MSSSSYKRILILSIVTLLLPGISLAAGTDDSPTDVAMIAATGEAARYWNRWRGPSGQGLVAGDGYVDSWSEDRNILWKVEVPGRGNSSPIIWADRLFLTAAEEGGRQRSILSFRLADGELHCRERERAVRHLRRQDRLLRSQPRCRAYHQNGIRSKDG